MEQAATAARGWYDTEGLWIAATFPPEVRERYWICFALYQQGQKNLADAIILASTPRISHMGEPSATSYDIFHSNIAAVLLKMHGARMSEAVQRKLEELVRDSFAFQAGNRRPDYQFHGYNDNMPAKASMGLILGGEMLGNSEAVGHGLWNLRQLRRMLMRRGTISEWNSPTYSAGTLSAIAKIAHYADHPEARELAAGIEERLWLDLAARFHPGMGVLSGPYSRAYTVDTVAHATNVAALFWFVLGDIAKPSPVELFDPGCDMVIHHYGDIPFSVAERCWAAAGAYHPSRRALELFTHKEYPFHAAATAEVGPADPEFDAHPLRLETFLQEDFTVGTASSSWLDGNQMAPYFVTYKRTDEIGSFRNVGTVFHKFAVDEEIPGTIRAATDRNNRAYENSGEEVHLPSHNHIVTLQSGPSVLALTTPRLALGGVEGKRGPRMLTRLNEMVIFPSHFGGADEIRVGNQARPSWSGEVTQGEWIGCRRGRLLVAVRPLVYLPGPQKVGITLEKINRYEMIRSTFYQGPARTFTREELRCIFGGFVAEHASVDEYPSLSAFMESLSGSHFTDYYWTTRRVCYRRPASANKPPLELEVSWSPASVVTRYSLINGQAVSQDERVVIDGLREDDFPFLKEPWISEPPYFPWAELKAEWPGGNSTGFIGDLT